VELVEVKGYSLLLLGKTFLSALPVSSQMKSPPFCAIFYVLRANSLLRCEYVVMSGEPGPGFDILAVTIFRKQ